MQIHYFQPIKLVQRTAHERLARICFIEHDREMALVAEHTDPQSEERIILEVGRVRKIHGTNKGEVAVIVSERWQRWRLGTELVRRLLAIGNAEQLDCVAGIILTDHHAMQRICTQLGFRMQSTVGDPTTVTVVFDLHGDSAAAGP